LKTAVVLRPGQPYGGGRLVYVVAVYGADIPHMASDEAGMPWYNVAACEQELKSAETMGDMSWRLR